MPNGVVTRKGRPGLWLRFNAKVRTADGRTLRRSILHKAQATTMAAAVREAALLRQQVEQQLLEDDVACRRKGGPTWGDAVDLYLADCIRRRTRHDRECYRLALAREGLGAETPLNLVDSAMVLAWRDRLQQERGLKASSLNHYTALVTTVLNLATARGLREEVPLRLRKLEEGAPQPVEFFTVAQVVALLEAAGRIQDRRAGRVALPIRDLVALHYYTAARTSSVLELTWDQVDLEAATVTFPTTKNRRRVVAPIPPAAVAILEARPGPRRGLVLGARWHNYSHTWRQVVGLANELLEERGEAPIPSKARLYCLRHSRATHLAGAGATAKAVADLLGDRLSMVERRYYGFDLEGIRDGLRTAAASSLLGALEVGKGAGE